MGNKYTSVHNKTPHQVLVTISYKGKPGWTDFPVEAGKTETDEYHPITAMRAHHFAVIIKCNGKSCKFKIPPDTDIVVAQDTVGLYSQFINADSKHPEKMYLQAALGELYSSANKLEETPQ